MSAQDNLQAWTVFLTMAQTGSVTQTAEQLNMAGPNISRTIRELEHEMGFTLFKRKRRPFELTPRGAELATLIRPMVANLKATIESFCTPLTRLIRVAAPVDLNRLFINEQLISYAETHPEIQFELSGSVSVEDIQEKKVDIALMERPASSIGLVVRSCIQSRAVPLATPEYLREHGVPATPEDLRRHFGVLLRREQTSVTSFLFRGKEQSCLLKWKRFFFVDDQLSLRELALRHRGIAVDLPAQFVTEELKNGAVVPVLPGWERKPWDLCIVTRRDREAESDALHEFALWWVEREGKDALKRVEAGQAVQQPLLNAAPT